MHVNERVKKHDKKHSKKSKNKIKYRHYCWNTFFWAFFCYTKGPSFSPALFAQSFSRLKNYRVKSTRQSSFSAEPRRQKTL